MSTGIDDGGPAFPTGTQVSQNSADERGDAMNKHTPGPWKVIDISSKKEVVYRRIDSRRRNIGFVSAYREPNQSVSEANARLIAAAPDLLEALQAMVDHGSCSDEEDFFKARAAIAKATP